MDLLPELDSRPSAFALVLVFLAGLAINLVAYGVYRFPDASPLRVSGAFVALIGYAVVAFTVVRAMQNRAPAVLGIATRTGLAAAAVFSAEICFEHIFVAKSTVAWGSIEFGLIALIYSWAGAWLTVERHTMRDTVLGSAFAAMLSLVIWDFFALGAFFLFHGTARQHQVSLAEMENLFDATFVRLILGPFVAATLAALVFAVLKLAKISQRPARAKAASAATK
jgi:hypothetical protein